jgi:hypothetical protein
MERGGRRFPLVIYQEMVNRWWPWTLFLSVVLLGLTWPTYNDALAQAQPWRWMGMLILGGVSLLFTMLLLGMKSMAYVQAFPTYVKLATPFLRLKISYKRLRRATTAEMRALFPPDKMRGWKYDLLAPLGGRTAVVLELNGWPAAPNALRIFLSPFFFKDTTPHFVILVNDWMRFSTELESMRSGGGNVNQPRPRNQSILTRLPKKE